MIKSAIRIFGILIRDKDKENGCVQEILARYVNSIKTRLGVYEVEHAESHPYGLILIQVIGSEEDMDRFEKEIYAIEGVEIQHMFFEP
jgi:UTP-glucose-1-phosphate uridylyltransferase